MKQAEPTLLLNCPKCDSGRLMFARDDNKHVRLECMDCKHTMGGFRERSLDAAKDWNKR